MPSLPVKRLTFRVRPLAHKHKNISRAICVKKIILRLRSVAADLKKTRNLNGSKLEPALKSCDTGQRIPCFDSCL